jgi:hypothetical protein
VKPPSLEQAALDPIVDGAIANFKVFSRLLDGQLLGLLECRRWNAMASADPLDHLRRVRRTRGTGMPFSVELFCNLHIE